MNISKLPLLSGIVCKFQVNYLLTQFSHNYCKVICTSLDNRLAREKQDGGMYGETGLRARNRHGGDVGGTRLAREEREIRGAGGAGLQERKLGRGSRGVQTCEGWRPCSSMSACRSKARVTRCARPATSIKLLYSRSSGLTPFLHPSQLHSVRCTHDGNAV